MSKSWKANDDWKVGIAVVVGIVAVIGLTLLGGWIVQTVWNGVRQYMFPNLPYMPFWIGLGISMVIGMFRATVHAKSN